MKAFLIIIGVILIILIYFFAKGLKIMRKKEKEALLFTRDFKEITNIMEREGIDYKEAKEKHLKFCKDRGIKTLLNNN